MYSSSLHISTGAGAVSQAGQTNGQQRQSMPGGSRVRQIIQEFNSVAKSEIDRGVMEPVSPRANGSACIVPHPQQQEQKQLEEKPPQQEEATEGWEQRLAGNIEWIRNEITELKKQDKSLTRQFIELRSVIHHLRRYGFINRLPNTLHEDVIPITEQVECIETTPTNTPPVTPSTPQLSPRKNTQENIIRYQTLPSKKYLNHPRGPGEPKASPPKHFFTDDSSLDSDSSDSMDDNDDDISEIGYRPRAVSMLTPTWINSPSPGGSFLNRSRNMSFTSGATEDEYDC